MNRFSDILGSQYGIAISMNDQVMFVNNLRGKLIRMFYKEFDEAHYVYVQNAYVLGDDVWLKVHDYETSDDDFRLVRLSDIETFEYYEDDEDE